MQRCIICGRLLKKSLGPIGPGCAKRHTRSDPRLINIYKYKKNDFYLAYADKHDLFKEQ